MGLTNFACNHVAWFAQVKAENSHAYMSAYQTPAPAPPHPRPTPSISVCPRLLESERVFHLRIIFGNMFILFPNFQCCVIWSAIITHKPQHLQGVWNICNPHQALYWLRVVWIAIIWGKYPWVNSTAGIWPGNYHKPVDDRMESCAKNITQILFCSEGTVTSQNTQTKVLYGGKCAFLNIRMLDKAVFQKHLERLFLSLYPPFTWLADEW